MAPKFAAAGHITFSVTCNSMFSACVRLKYVRFAILSHAIHFKSLRYLTISVVCLSHYYFFSRFTKLLSINAFLLRVLFVFSSMAVL